MNGMYQKHYGLGAVCTRKTTMVHPKKSIWYIIGFSITIRRNQKVFGIPRSWQCAQSSDLLCVKEKGWEYQWPKLVQSGISQKKRDIPLCNALGYWSSQWNLTAFFWTTWTLFGRSEWKKNDKKGDVLQKILTLHHFAHSGENCANVCTSRCKQ